MYPVKGYSTGAFTVYQPQKHKANYTNHHLKVLPISYTNMLVFLLAHNFPTKSCNSSNKSLGGPPRTTTTKTPWKNRTMTGDRQRTFLT